MKMFFVLFLINFKKALFPWEEASVFLTHMPIGPIYKHLRGLWWGGLNWLVVKIDIIQICVVII